MSQLSADYDMSETIPRVQDETAEVNKVKVADVYKRRTVKMSKKEARNISTPTRSIRSDMEQEHGDLEMEWEDAPDIEKAWRLAIAKEKTELRYGYGDGRGDSQHG